MLSAVKRVACNVALSFGTAAVANRGLPPESCWLFSQGTLPLCSLLESGLAAAALWCGYACLVSYEKNRFEHSNVNQAQRSPDFIKCAANDELVDIPLSPS